MKKLFLAVLAVLILSQAYVRAQFTTGNELNRLIPSYEKYIRNPNQQKPDWTMMVEYVKYTSYITGVYDATCSRYDIPEGFTNGQLLAVVTKYLKDHPEKWNRAAAGLILEALEVAFPLKKPTAQK